MNKTTKTQEGSEVHVTTDYSIFKGYVGNRVVNMHHVNDLIKSIARKNMLAQNPIMVNENMQVIDGQHRLEAAKANNLPLYYMIVSGGNLEDIQALNTSSLRWTALDFLKSYVEQGAEQYIELEKYLSTGIRLTNLVQIFSRDTKEKGGGVWSEFKRGKFTFRNKEQGDMVVEALVALKPFATQRAWNDREFVSALTRALHDVTLPELMMKIDEYGQKIEGRASVRDYLRQLEEIVNWNMRTNITRFF